MSWPFLRLSGEKIATQAHSLRAEDAPQERSIRLRQTRWMRLPALLLFLSTLVQEAAAQGIRLEGAWVTAIAEANTLENAVLVPSLKYSQPSVNTTAALTANSVSASAALSASASTTARIGFDGAELFTLSGQVAVTSSTGQAEAGAAAFYYVDFEVLGTVAEPTFSLTDVGANALAPNGVAIGPDGIVRRDGGSVSSPLTAGHYRAFTRLIVVDDDNALAGVSDARSGYDLRFPAGLTSIGPGFDTAHAIPPSATTAGGVSTFPTTSSSARWYSMPVAKRYFFEATSPAKFSDVMVFPAGFGGAFVVKAEGTTLGTFSPGQTLHFSNTLGHDVDRFEIRGIDMAAGGSYPLMLGFSADTAGFTVTAIPDPEVQAASQPNGDLQVSFKGLLQTSGDLTNWTLSDPQPASPLVIPKAQLIGHLFYRAREL